MLVKLQSPYVGILLAGVALGLAGVYLVVAGNPENTGICVSCFLANIAGSLGMHGELRMSYPRPEIPGILLGAFLAATIGGGFRVRASRSPLLVLLAGAAVIVGCEVFMGCPIKMVLRMAAGDLTAVAGAAGLATGIAVGVGFMRRGLELPSTPRIPAALGYLLPAAALLMATLAYLRSGLLRFAESGPAAQHAPMALSLGSGLVLGALAQRSRFCVTGAFRNLLVGRDWSLMAGFAALAGSALVANLIAGTFHPGYFDQPGSHPVVLWNFMGMFVAGLGSMVIGGCPFRQLTLAGEGDTGASLAVVGMLGGAAACRLFGISSTVEGPTWIGRVVLLSSLAFLLAVGLARTKEG